MEFLELYGIERGKGQHHEEAIYGLALIYNMIYDEVSQYLKSYHLTPGKFNILLVIRHHSGPQGIPQVEISKHLIVTPSNMTKLIDKLEREDLVVRSALEGDRRVKITRITPKGSDLLNKVWKGYKEMLKALMPSLSQADQKLLSSLLIKWLLALKSKSKEMEE